MTENELIEKCRRKDSVAQKMLFEYYAPLMLGICRRYVSNPQDAEDVMLQGFFKVFTKIDYFKGEGSFEGWIRRIMINESLMHIRQNYRFQFKEELNAINAETEDPEIVDEIAAEEIIALLDEMPQGYRTVFNLYVIEGYKHREIAEKLGISINTSKSQLILAKQRMTELVRLRLGIRNFSRD